jgi:quinolinate synthase
MPDLPEAYLHLSDAELTARIAARKAALGDELVILGHHYQSDAVIQFADFRGDSLKLARLAAEQHAAKYIVFCGVHFMAESADIVSAPEQIVCLPNRQAGCAMAEMADADSVSAAMDDLGELAGEGTHILPVVYVNSTAAVKAVVGRAGGACCTSSNVRGVFDWALDQAGADKIFAIPDQHLARNTAEAMGYDIASACAVYDPREPAGGLRAEQVREATFLLWQGHCYVHQLFTVEQVRAIRQAHPDVQVIVHPECPRSVVAAADQAGSTSQIITTIDQAPAGSVWAVGTEGNLVHRLADQYPDKTIVPLGETMALCAQMGMIDLPHLLWSLDSIAAGEPVNVVRVAPALAEQARTALDRMLAIGPTGR